MRGLLAIIYKELLILVRDIPGLLILFIMPVFLILIVTLAQETALQKIKESRISILFIDKDNSSLGETIEKGLTSSDFFKVIKELEGKQLSESEAKIKIANGEFQVGIVIPEDATELAFDESNKLIAKYFSGEKTDSDFAITTNKTTNILIYFDPAISNSYKNSVSSSIKGLVNAAETKIMLDNFFSLLPGEMNLRINQLLLNELKRQLNSMETEVSKRLEEKLGDYAPENLNFNIPENLTPDISQELNNTLSLLDFHLKDQNILGIEEIFAQKNTAVIKPTVVQNNVPAFALFAMFFIVIPLAGSIIAEKNEGAYDRIRTLPVSYFFLLSGKVIIYTIVCLLQFVLMLLCGIYILPELFGVIPLETGTNYAAIVVAAFASALAAIGFGLLVGTYANTHGQAAMFGSVMVVILGILGGIFFPVYLMPDTLNAISLISPIRWGIDSFLDIFVREGDIISIMPDIVKLVLFFCIALSLSLFTFVKRI
ncbi:MAG: ABC transporter permease [Bacteroidota bacterium]